MSSEVNKTDIVCPKCGVNKALLDKDLGWCLCAGCRKEPTPISQSQLSALQMRIGIPKIYYGARLGDYPQALVNRILKNTEQLERGLVLYGSVCRGKTYMLTALVNYLILDLNKTDILWFSFIELLDKLKNSFNCHSTNTQDIIDSLYNAEHLFLDDIKLSKDSVFTYETLYRVLNNRWNAGKATYFSLNCDDLESAIDDRLYWRMTSESYTYKMIKNYKK